jgi:putative tryptophan/tyrosine transport system substrate-binding protein
MKRRTFIALLGGASTWPVVTRAQQPALPVIGFLGTTSAESTSLELVGFRQGLSDAGYVERRDVAIEYRWAEGQNSRLPTLAADLVQRQVAVIVATSNSAALAAKAVAATIPIVFQIGGDPVRLGLVASLNRPGGTLTGVVALNDVLIKKRLELLHEMVPKAAVIGVLVNPQNPDIETRLRDVQDAAQAIGQEIHVLTASTEAEIDAAFSTLVQQAAGAILIQNDPFLSDQRRGQIVTLAVRHGVPAGFEQRTIVEAGGLMSYGANRPYLYRQVGIYAGRVLKGEKPAELPVQQPTKFELAVNLTTAKALGLMIPESFLLRADEVIE